MTVIDLNKEKMGKQIKPNDLRIGNWLYSNDSKFPMKVSVIGAKYMELNIEDIYNDPIGFNRGDISPIPLTSDILEKIVL